MSIAESSAHAGRPIMDDEYQQDPHTWSARLRADAPAHQVITTTGMRAWVVSRYAEAKAALNDPRLGKDHRGTKAVFDRKIPSERARPEMIGSLQAHMLNMDPPDHTRLRKLVVKAFTPRRVEELRPRVEAITAELLDAMAEQSEVDLLDAFAFPLPIRVISELLGVPRANKDEFREWSNTMLASTDLEATRAAGEAMSRFLVQLIAEKREEPGDDLLTALIAVSEDADQLAEHELVAMVFLLLVAGHETTVNLIANGALALLRHPDQLATLRAAPDRVADVVEETLRYDGPVRQATLRHTLEPVTFGEVQIPEGEIVIVGLGAANRDDAKFADPDAFDVEHDTRGHLAFGFGIHFCIGAQLARLEGQIALRALTERFPDLSLAVEPEQLRWRVSTIMRGLERMPVRTGR